MQEDLSRVFAIALEGYTRYRMPTGSLQSHVDTICDLSRSVMCIAVTVLPIPEAAFLPNRS